MANNQEFFCNHCQRETLFFWDSDLIWYCDECGNSLDSNPILKKEEIEEELQVFESDYEEAIYCKTCGNFVEISEVIEDGICPYCADELDEEIESKGYEYDYEEEKYVKVLEGEHNKNEDKQD